MGCNRSGDLLDFSKVPEKGFEEGIVNIRDIKSYAKEITWRVANREFVYGEGDDNIVYLRVYESLQYGPLHKKISEMWNLEW